MSGMELDEDQKEEEEERSVTCTDFMIDNDNDNDININNNICFYHQVTCRDIKLIMPTVLILLFTLFVMVGSHHHSREGLPQRKVISMTSHDASQVTVIPYAFSSVIKQLQAVMALEAQGE